MAGDTTGIDTPVIPKETDDGLNATNLYCPRCSCLILKPCMARRSDISIQLPSIRKNETGKSPLFYWVVHDMMSFENIGFTKTLPNQEVKKYMICAECDLGPLGVQTDLFYLAGDRVKEK